MPEPCSCWNGGRAVVTARKSDDDPTRFLLDLWDDVAEYRTLSDGLRKKPGAHMVYGLTRGVEAFLLAAMGRDYAGCILVLCASCPEAQRIAGDVRSWLGEDEAEYLPPSEILPHPEVVRDSDSLSERLRVLGRLVNGDPIIITASIEAAERLLPPKESMGSAFFSVRRGEQTDRDRIVHRLADIGYRRQDLVEEPGEYAVRGGIVDAFSPLAELPVRIEFFGDVIDSIRAFDPQTQRSGENVDEARIGPAAETFPAAGDLDSAEAVRSLQDEADRHLGALKAAGGRLAAEELGERIREQAARLVEGSQYPNFDLFMPYFASRLDTIFDYLPDRAAVVVCDPVAVREAVEQRTDKIERRLGRLVDSAAVLPGQLDMVTPPPHPGSLPERFPRYYMSNLLSSLPGEDPHSVTRIGSRPSDTYHGQWELFLSDVQRWSADGRRVLVAAASAGRAGRLRGSLSERGFGPEDRFITAHTRLSCGFEVYTLNLTVITEADIFGGARPVRYQVPRKHRRDVTSYEDLVEGDYVVHRHHGIGRYLGLSSKEVQGSERDYLVISYAEGDRLYVPVDSIELVQKYVGQEGKPPRIYLLGSGEWKRVKKRVRESLRDMAEELLRLYSARQAVKGHPFSADTPWQREFEDAFAYEDTRDQGETTQRIKEAMERSHPMDYLLCGDVGYGKTEVALRAAFKAILDGKQVALLVPTTILAHQHYQTARDRLAGWPCNVDMLSRFRSQGEQERTITRLRKGQVDLVIGTHRLLQGDVQFRDLGLVIVDEEHRFGVADKEHLKQLKQTVDVLTLTATPIPRTLHMALSGIRDMGVIETPPEDRLPVTTYVMQYEHPVIADAIRRELDRDGQVFYVHNRVHSIERARRRVEQLVPQARVAVAHGQMSEQVLESVMDQFVAGHYDVLVCTTIIESGLDIPNANTLVVEDADRLGLAQLYQLRGRVGRSDRLAYCYLTYRSAEVLASLASERLSALREFTELGAGFRLAKRDLELRGAGNVLGAEQHGFMLAVGFDLYTRMLKEEIAQLRGEHEPPMQRPAVELNVDAYLAEDYVPSSSQRVALYRRINGIRSLSEARDVLDEMIDRYGDPPDSAVNLVRLAMVSVLGARRGVLSVSQQGRGVLMELLPDHGDEVDWQEVSSAGHFRCTVSRIRSGSKIRVDLVPRSDSPSGAALLVRVEKMLREASAASD